MSSSPSVFPLTPLSELLSNVVDNRGRTCPTAQEGIPLIATNCITNHSIFPVFSKVRYVSQETYDTWFRQHPLPGDIVLVNKGSPGNVALVPDPVTFCFAQDMLAIRPIESIDNFYLFAALKSAQVRAQVENIQVGTTIPHFKKSDFDKLLIPVPPLPAQKAIGLLHYRLGLKVETNRRISENLESIAQTLFRSWFVDFDPVRAKMAGEKPAGMDDATAELFPDSMEESELGEIPAGWKVGDLGELCHLTMGQSPPGDAYNLSGEGLPFYQGRTDFGMRFPKTRMYSTLGNRKASPGDVLVSVRAPVGDLNQALEECVIGRGVAAVIHRSGSQAYSYSLMQSIQHRLEYFNGEGTVFGAINKTDFSSIPLVEPPVELLNRFDELASPVNGLLRSLHEQSQNLAATRDALLPRLISGELEVPEDLLVS